MFLQAGLFKLHLAFPVGLRGNAAHVLRCLIRLHSIYRLHRGASSHLLWHAKGYFDEDWMEMGLAAARRAWHITGLCFAVCVGRTILLSGMPLSHADAFHARRAVY